MTLKELLDLLEQYAPLKLSAEYCAGFGAYDNSGIILDSGSDVNGVVFALDLSMASLGKALELGYNTIVTHHPAIYGGIQRIDAHTGSDTQAISECIHHGISVISMHLNLDTAPGGIDESLMEACGGTEPLAVQEEIPGGGYGRVYNVAPAAFKDMYGAVKKTLGAERIICFGDMDRPVKRVASFCGAGCSDGAIAFAAEQGADVFVSSDMKHHQITAIINKGMNIIVPTHYAAELYGFRKFAKAIAAQLDVPSDIYCDSRLL